MIKNNKIDLHLYDSGLLTIPFEYCVTRNIEKELYIDDIPDKRQEIAVEKMDEIKGPNYVALQGTFSVYNPEKNIVTKLKPQNRYYPVTNIFTTEASIHTNLFRYLYIVLGEGNLNEGWVVRTYYNPLVIWIWIGAVIIFLGGIASMKINLQKLKKIPL